MRMTSNRSEIDRKIKGQRANKGKGRDHHEVSMDVQTDRLFIDHREASSQRQSKKTTAPGSAANEVVTVSNELKLSIWKRGADRTGIKSEIGWE
jgi:hypothetical protein